MSTVKKPEMTETKLAAQRRNARKSHGPTTAEGKERVRDANLRHGFYSQDCDTALRALGEKPEDYDAVVKAVREQWRPANEFQELLATRLVRALWRMDRADRMQEGYALRQAKEVSLSREDRLHAQMMRLKMTADSLRLLAQAAARKYYVTSARDLELMKSLHQEGSVKEMGGIAVALFYQLQGPQGGEADRAEAEAKYRAVIGRVREIFGLSPDSEPQPGGAPAASSPQGSPQAAGASEGRTADLQKRSALIGTPEGPPEVGAQEPEEDAPPSDFSAAEWENREPVRQLLEHLLTRQVEICEAQRSAALRESLAGPSPYERAAEIAPTQPNAPFLQRMEDSNLRQVWRTTNMLLKIKRQAQKADEKGC